MVVTYIKSRVTYNKEYFPLSDTIELHNKDMSGSRSARFFVDCMAAFIVIFCWLLMGADKMAKAAMRHAIMVFFIATYLGMLWIIIHLAKQPTPVSSSFCRYVCTK